jgi:hypothetical protein
MQPDRRKEKHNPVHLKKGPSFERVDENVIASVNETEGITERRSKSQFAGALDYQST